METSYYVGIDVSKETLDFSVVEANLEVFYLRVPNTKKGIKKFFEEFSWTGKSGVETMIFCMEHTGIYNFHALEYLHSAKARIWLESATKIKKSLGLQRGKSDKVDAMRIAQYAYKNRDEVRLLGATQKGY